MMSEPWWDERKGLIAEIATLREGRDLARQAGAELAEEVKELREALMERSIDAHYLAEHDKTKRGAQDWKDCDREPCRTDRRRTQEERDDA